MKKILMLCMFINSIYAMDISEVPLPTTEDFKIAEELYVEYLNLVSYCQSYERISFAHGKDPHIDLTKLQRWIDQEILKRFEGRSEKQQAIARAYFLSPFGQKILPGEHTVHYMEIGQEYTFTWQELVDFNKVQIVSDCYDKILLLHGLCIKSISSLNQVIARLNKKTNGLWRSKAITSISLNNNQIASLDINDFEAFHNVRELDFSNNHLTHIEANNIQASFKKLESINLRIII